MSDYTEDLYGSNDMNELMFTVFLICGIAAATGIGLTLLGIALGRFHH